MRSKSRHLPTPHRPGRHVEFGLRPACAKRKRPDDAPPIIRIALANGEILVLTGDDVEPENYSALDDFGRNDDGGRA